METNNIYLSFIILVLVIGISYWYQKTNQSKIIYEGFDTPQTTQRPQTTLAPQTTQTQQTTNALLFLSDSFREQLSTISDNKTKEIVSAELISLKQILDRYSNLDIPIVINDKGNLCSNWGNYQGGKYNNDANKCQIIDDSNSYKCLDDNNLLNTCNNIYSDGYIKNWSKVNYNQLLNNNANTLFDNITKVSSKIEKMNQNADTLINKYADLNTLEMQQRDIIDNNKANMEDKKRIMEEKKSQFSKKKNETNTNQNNFSLFMKQINDNDSWNNLYYRIVLGLIITILIVGVLNFLFSNILS